MRYFIKAPLCRIPGSECDCYVSGLDEDQMTIEFSADQDDAMIFYNEDDAEDVVACFEGCLYQIMSDTMPCDDDLEVVDTFA